MTSVSKSLSNFWQLASIPIFKIQSFPLVMLIFRQQSFQFCVPCLKTQQFVLPYNSRPHLIEKIIAKDLCNVDTYQRFTLLWHLSRDLELKSSTSPEHRRTFDICLLKMLDTLNMTGGPLKVLSQVRNHKEKLVKSHQTPCSHFDFTIFNFDVSFFSPGWFMLWPAEMWGASWNLCF